METVSCFLPIAGVMILETKIVKIVSEGRSAPGMGADMDLRQQILEGAIRVFNARGIKFTMDDLAKALAMSKKTIYTVFRDKNDLFLAMVTYLFDGIKAAEQAIVEDPSLSTLEKIKRILSVMPDSYQDIDFRRLYLLKDKYPAIYKQVELRLEGGWESTIALLEQGMAEGVIRRVSIPIVKMMLEASLEQFFQRDILVRNDLSYQAGLEEVVGILLEGIIVQEGTK